MIVILRQATKEGCETALEHAQKAREEIMYMLHANTFNARSNERWIRIADELTIIKMLLEDAIAERAREHRRLFG